ncbi:MAG: hypothetical protein GAK43_00756 [Stenotrophomonas maltophilia]|nr:MAG: hypothetical protein GAK43_00756 [Stenotrophomonas maltophilia]
MFRDFRDCTARTDAMHDGSRYVGLIEFQPKSPGASVQVLWVIDPRCVCSSEAATAADEMLCAICDIRADGEVLYADGVPL